MRRDGWQLWAVVYVVAGCGGDLPSVSFDGPSDKLERTVVLATLDEPIPEGKNAIWCASFEVAWKELMDFAGESIALEGDPPLAKALNDAPDRRSAIPVDSLYTFAGLAPPGTVETMRSQITEKFPDASLSILPELSEGGVIAYAYLQAEVPFAIPYFQHDEPLGFNEADGSTVNITSFGIRKKDSDAFARLREQAWIIPIVEAPEDPEHAHDPRPAIEYALDLDVTSHPNQLVIAKTAHEETLQLGFEKVEAKIRKAEARPPFDAYLFHLGVYDTVFVPDIVVNIAKHFSELEGRMPSNAKLENLPLILAMEAIRFRLTRSGAELRSEAAQHYASASMPQDYIVDGPFLIYMKKRGADQPYFAMWVDNAELLHPWTE